MQDDKITRRKFVAGTAGATLGTMIVPRHVLGGPGYNAPSDTLNIALVGCGGRGASDASELVAGGQNIVALADVDFDYVDSANANRAKGHNGKPNPSFVKLQEAFGKAKRYDDFRIMLEKQKDIDAVVVATPDHCHAVVAKTAMELGKHVYVEKPMAWSVHEVRVLRETAKRTKVVTQMGNQGHSSNEARLINEWVQAGVIGPVREVYVWTNRPIWPQGVPRPATLNPSTEGSLSLAASGSTLAASSGQAAGGRRQAGAALGSFGNRYSQKRVNRETAAALAGDNRAVPTHLHWDLFLGPGPEVPYHPIYHPFNWRGWIDWGTGALGDMGAHLIDHPFWALGLSWPTLIETTSTPFGTDNDNKPVSYPLASQVVYHFPARGNQPPVRMIWCDGGLMAPRPEILPADVPLQRDGGVIFIGEKGILTHETYGEKPRIFPESLMEEAKKVPQKYERIETDQHNRALHQMNWAKACKGQAKASSPFEYASMLTETMLLGIVALRTGQGAQIQYDGENGKVTNISEANQYLQREYRRGWTL